MENQKYLDKTNEELLREFNALKIEHELLKTAYQASVSKCNVLSVNLKERIKELGAIYRLGNLLDNPNITLEEIMQEVAGFLPLSWQYPECSCARLVYRNLEYTSADYKESDWKMSKPIVVNNSVVGLIEVNYTEQKPSEYEGPFLKEEFLLLEVISERMGKIIQRYQAEKELRFSEEKFAASFMASPAAMSIHDLDDHNRFLDVNQAFLEITGYQRFEIIGRTPDDLQFIVDPETRNILYEQFKLYHKIQNKEYAFRKKNGEIGYGLINVEFYRIHAKNFAITATNEITDARRTKISLEKSQLLLDTIINSTSDLIYSVDSENFGLLSFNKSYSHFYSRVYNLQVKKGMRPEDIGQPEYLTEIWRQFYQRALREDHFTIEHQFEKPDLYLHLTFNLLKRNGKVFGISVFSKDITDRKRAENALKEEYNFRIAVENSMQAGIAVVDITGKQSIVNKYFANMVGWSPDELLGQQVPFAYWPPNEISTLTHAFQQTLNGVAPKNGFELKFRKKNGELFDVLVNLSSLKNAQDATIGWLAIVNDISDLKQAERDLIVAKEKAEESDKLKTAFLLNLSHEIRTPMSCIIGFSDLLKKQSLTGDQQHQYIELISKGGDRMLDIINDLVDISKIEAGVIDINLKETNIVNQIRYAYDSFMPEAGRKGLIFTFNEKHCLKNPMVYTDEEKFYSIISNLIENAIKYTQAGTIEIGCIPKNNEIEIYVKDTGIGIPDNRQEAIFDRFVHADIDDTEAFQGAGLGLSIAKSFVEMLGGSIHVKSQVGVGSTFTFSIPCNNYQESDYSELAENDRSEQISDTKKLKILITEDDADIATIIEKTIQDLSFEILFAGTGEQAVDICEHQPDIDLIIMDINLPGIDGIAATQKIRTFNNKVVIIAQTAYTQKGDREKVLAAGCNDYISKPFRISDLYKLVEKYCVV